MASSPVAGAAVEVAVGDAGGVEAGADPGQVPGELAEDEGPVALGDHLGEVVEQPVELGRPDVVVRLVDEAGVEGELAEDGERLEDLEAVLLHVADEAEHLLALPLELGLRRSGRGAG